MSAFSGLLTGLAGAYVLALISCILPICAILVAPIYGRFVADGILSFAGNGRGRKIEAIGVGSILLGAFVALGSPIGATRILAATGSSSMSDISQAIIGISLGIAVTVCYSRLKPKQS